MLELQKLLGRKLKPSEFAKVFFDFDLFKYQTKALDCHDRFVMLNWGRQTGKSTVTALAGLYDAMWNDDHVVLVLSPKQRQSNRLFGKMKSFLTRSQRKFPELKLYNEVIRETQTILEFANGSEIHSLPISDDGSNIRGFTANMVIVDEASRITNEESWGAIRPMIITTNGKFWLISTPKGVNNYFYQCFKRKELGFTYFHATSYDNPMADMKQGEGDREWMPIMLWEEEYLANFIDESDSFFPLSITEKFLSKTIQERDSPLPMCTYYLGVDVASGSGMDMTVYAILEKGPQWKAVVKYIETHENLMETVGRIIRLNEQWGFQNIYFDQTGLGTGPTQMLTNAGLPIIGIQQTMKVKEDIYNNLKLQIQNGLLSVWNDTCRKQMLDMKYEYTSQGFIKLYSGQSQQHNKPGGDDYCTAICLCGLALQKPRVPVFAATTYGLFGGD